MSVKKIASEILKKENPYNCSPCPICGEFAVGSCRCAGPHSLEDIKNGHGVICENGHYFSRDGKLFFDPKEK